MTPSKQKKAGRDEGHLNFLVVTMDWTMAYSRCKKRSRIPILVL